ncbi:hypothetical protein [Pseudomonas sp. HS-18]|uniref:hypothetical protein n=1 Tax=Pseudomonas sp. HS-18 TaxID=2879114 RepID=UPI001CEFC269|nr:hypothetical protein [Pseudomonas sp. HS-18]UCL84541.1 hypothetical protein LDJ84_16310 [Pseudomonas sp. HS-18]
MPDIREEFEASMLAIWRKTEGPFADLMFDRRRNNEYVQQVTRECWQAWKASRAALRVELPEAQFIGNQSCHNLAYYAEDVKEALRQAGIEVK